ncbi:MAG TPA: Wzy polymerase domain-containing protein [Methylibium sp.]|nr:Wzy polymerase domain-containing protein [Methylibium sp.]
MSSAPTLLRPSVTLLLSAALALPWLLAPSPVPDAVLYNQIAALAAWGVWLASGACFAWRAAAPALAALLLCAVLAAAGGFALQGGVALMLLSATLVLAAAAARADVASTRIVALGLWLAGLGSAGVALVQFLAPGWTDGWLIAASSTGGRAVGNLRQPNHLATALLCAMVWTVWLWQAGSLGGRAATASVAAMLLALAMTASRTGALSLVVLVAWAALDKRLPRNARGLLATTPLLYGLCWALLAGHAALQEEHFYGSDRLQAGGDISSSRFAIWRNALALLAEHPWAGVGWGHFNAAWTFTPFPGRPVAFFDHTHNLPLQLAVELGLPAAVTILGLLGWTLWRARAAWGSAAPASPARAALAMVAVLALHSLLEYPLWYAYFLLPAAWALGVFVGGAPRTVAPSAAGMRWAARAAGTAMAAGALWAGADHRRVEVIFAPAAGAEPLARRIEAGQRSALFGHHADYAAVTTPPRDTAAARFRRPLRQLIDVRLLIAYIEALKREGRVAEALYAAQRLREFHRPDAQAYFKDCEAAAPPWQCDTRPVALQWRDLMP